jgi:ribosomal subunit interface protein
MEITFKGMHTSVPERFRRHASAKLSKLEKLDHNAIRIDVEVSTERNPRQADRSERVELTIRSRGPAIRAEAAADDRYAALDLAFAKLEGRLRKAAERRKVRRGDLTVRSADVLAAVAAAPAGADAAVAESPDLADVAIPAIPMPDDAAMLNGTPVGRRAGTKSHGKPGAKTGARSRWYRFRQCRRTTRSTSPASATRRRSGRPSSACCRCRWWATARWSSGRSSTRRSR